MASADVHINDYTTVEYPCVSYGGVVGAWASPSSGGANVARIDPDISNFALRILVPRAKLRTATLRVHAPAGQLISPLYIGLVLHPAITGFSTNTDIDLARNRVTTNGVTYNVEFRQFIHDPLGGPTNIDISLAAYSQLQGIMYDIRLTSISLLFTSTYTLGLENVFTIDSETGGTPPKLILDHLIPAQGSNNDMSVSDVRHGERWFRCARCDFWFPLSRSVRDNERRGLLVCDSGCADLRGRKDTPKPGREREDRLWPRL